MDPTEITAAAKAAPAKLQLEEYREAVETLREKGYTWREVADFLTERGVATDHTRIYRLFGEKKSPRRKEARPVDISRMTFLGEKRTKRGRSWNVLEIELPSKLGGPITVQGFAWGASPPFVLGEDDAVAFREPTLVTRSGNKGFPVAYIEAQLRTEGDRWTPQEIYIAPRWDVLL